MIPTSTLLRASAILATVLFAGCAAGAGDAKPPPRASSNAMRTTTAFSLDTGLPWTFVRGPAWNGEARGSAITSANVQNLATLLQVSLGSAAYYSPVIAGATIVASSTRTVAAFDAESGRKLWSFSSPSHYTLFSAPTVVDGTVYVATAWKGAAVYALDLRTGSRLWSRDFGVSFAAYGAPTPIGTLSIIVGLANQTEPPCSHGAVLALNAASGETVWRHDTASMGNGAGVWNAANVAEDGSILVPVGNPCGGAANTEGDSILALDASSGTERWRYTAFDALFLDRRDDADYDFGATPVDASGLIVAPSKNGNVYAVNRATGSLRWRTPIAAGSSDPTRGGSISSPAWDGRLLYIGGGSATGDGTGMLNALTPTGAIVWKTSSPQPVTAPPTLSNDLVFAGFGNSLAALTTANGTIVWSAPAGGIVFGGPAVSRDRLCFSSEAGELFCFRLTHPGG